MALFQEHVGDRIVLEVVGDNFIPHGHMVSAYITSKFKLQQYESGDTWGHVDKDGKDFYYKEFLKIYTWQPGKEEEFKTTWNLYCQVQYKKLLHKWRKMSHPPGHVPNVVWSKWQSVWSGEKWKKNSETARNNRNSEVAGPGTGVTKHTAGSRSIIEHNLKLEADLKRKTDCWEVFRSTHRHKDGTFVDARSQAINDNMAAKLVEATQPSTNGEETYTPSQDDINNIYYEVVWRDEEESSLWPWVPSKSYVSSCNVYFYGQGSSKQLIYCYRRVENREC